MYWLCAQRTELRAGGSGGTANAFCEFSHPSEKKRDGKTAYLQDEHNVPAQSGSLSMGSTLLTSCNSTHATTAYAAATR